MRCGSAEMDVPIDQFDVRDVADGASIKVALADKRLVYADVEETDADGARVRLWGGGTEYIKQADVLAGSVPQVASYARFREIARAQARGQWQRHGRHIPVAKRAPTSEVAS